MESVKKAQPIYFTGIGGAGMSALAELLAQWGYPVAGSDRRDGPVTERLRQQGIKVYIGHKAHHVKDARLVVYSSAVPEDNPELMAAAEKGIPTVKRAALLGQLMTGKKGVAVAGTHGKTTTTSMIGFMFKACGLDPTAVVGGALADTGRGAMAGKGDWFVTEADEYDRSFLTLYPMISVINNLEADHLDIYHDMENLSKAFAEYARHTPLTGYVIYNGEDANVRKAVQEIYATPITFGLTPHMDYYARDIISSEEGTWCTVVYKGHPLGELRLTMPGRHNIRNALAALAAGFCAGLEFRKMAEALAAFGGVERRFQYKGHAGGALFYDDYAHHPTEVQAALEAARAGWNKRIVAVFQPHLFSRTRDFAQDFAEVLNKADTVILAPIYPAREKPMPGVNSALIGNLLSVPCTIAADREETADAIINQCRENTLILVMGAGDIWQIAETAMERQKRKSTEKQR